MEPPGGLAEVRLYRRPADGAALVELAALGLVAPPRLLEVSIDPPPIVDGDLGRSAGLYLALVQDGLVVDVARLLAYRGEAASPEELAEDYWKSGSNTSEEERAESEDDPHPRRATDVYQYRSTSSSSSSQELPGKSSSEEDGPVWHGGSDTKNGDNDGEAGEHQSGLLRMGRDQYHGNSSSDEAVDKDIWDVGSERDDGSEADDDRADDEMEEEEEEDDDDDEMEEEDDDEAEEVDGSEADDEDDEEADAKDDDHVKDDEEAEDEMEAEEEEDDDDEMEEEDDDEADDEDDEEAEGADAKYDEEADAKDDEEADGADANDDEEADAKDVEEADAKEDEGRLNVRLWPAKKHIRIKLFSGKKWITTKVYRLAWTNHEELEDLFESSFKMDICAPIPANTIFRNQNCVMDFELKMIHTPLFDELIAEFRVSVADFRFCQKVGGEDVCRVFKCLLEGSKFALKTLRLKEPCVMEPREVEIISSLHDKRVMAFCQAWVEPWIYKKKPMENYLFIQLELCQSTLQDLLLPENFDTSLDTWNLSVEIAKALKTIHDESILHRDLKPANIFFGADLGVRIGDFGDSCIGRDELGGYGGTPKLGTKYYSAPELQFAQKITEKVDVYSVGVIFLEIFTRFRTVFERIEVFEGLGKEEVPDFCCNLVGDREGVHGLVRRMISVEPADRPSDTELLEFLQHNFTSEGLGDGAD